VNYDILVLLDSKYDLEFADIFAEILAKMSQSGTSGTSKSTGSKSAGAHPSYAVMIQQGLSTMKVSYYYHF